MSRSQANQNPETRPAAQVVVPTLRQRMTRLLTMVVNAEGGQRQISRALSVVCCRGELGDSRSAPIGMIEPREVFGADQ